MAFEYNKHLSVFTAGPTSNLNSYSKQVPQLCPVQKAMVIVRNPRHSFVGYIPIFFGAASLF